MSACVQQREAEARVAAAMAYEFLRRFCNASGSSSRFDEFMVGHVGALAVNGAASSLREAFTRYHALDRAARERLLTQVARDLLGYASLERMCEHVQAQHDAAAGASCQLAEEEDAPASSRHVSSSPARSLEAADVAARAALVVPREDREHPRAAPAAAAAVQQQQQQQQQQQEEQEEQEGQEEREMGAEGGGEYEAVLRAAPPCIKFSASEPISLWDHVLPDGTIRSTSSSTSTSTAEAREAEGGGGLEQLRPPPPSAARAARATSLLFPSQEHEQEQKETEEVAAAWPASASASASAAAAAPAAVWRSTTSTSISSSISISSSRGSRGGSKAWEETEQQQQQQQLEQELELVAEQQGELQEPRGRRMTTLWPGADGSVDAAAAAQFVDMRVEHAKWLTKAQIRDLTAAGFHTVRQVLQHYPRTYINYTSDIASWHLNPHVATTGTITSTKAATAKSGVNMVILMIECPLRSGGDGGGGGGTAVLKLLKFFGKGFGMRYANGFARQHPEGSRVTVAGKIAKDEGGVYELEGNSVELRAAPPSSSAQGQGQGLQAVHPACKEVEPRTFSLIFSRMLPMLPGGMDPLPPGIQERHQLVELGEAYEGMHCPQTMQQVDRARTRLVFDEFFYHQLGMLYTRQKAHLARLQELGLEGSIPLEAPEPLPVERWPEGARALLQQLPYRLTASQLSVACEVLADMERPIPMSRLLQGDVGCGKTVVALLALVATVGRGCQGAMLAPTEFLAQQHLARFESLLQDLPPACRPSLALLTGSTKKAKGVREALARGEVDVVVGTHALLSEATAFKRLGLAVVDEQHRFGVDQRARLHAKGPSDGEAGSAALPPHVLAMSATPIPRTLALALYGDMAISRISELPPGRQPVRTRVVFGDSDRHTVYRTVREEVEKGGRAFIVYPLIEESEKVPDKRAATLEYERLSTDPSLLGGLPCGLVHGRMPIPEKLDVMHAFKDGLIKVLVSTTVIEVGIDIPEATVMVVEHADSYGMASLHQLRGRVGRGSRAAMCLLLTDKLGSVERLHALQDSQDGFYLAEKDLENRGPGEMLGKKQSGHLPEFHLARLEQDGHIMEAAREAAEELIKESQQLEAYPRLRMELNMRAPPTALGQ